MSYANGIDYARGRDRADPLGKFRAQFFLPQFPPGRDSIYLCGHSLGLQPRKVPELFAEELEDWQTLGVEGHFHARRPWMPYHELLTERVAMLAGAQADEVVCMNGLTVNLHLMMVSFYRPSGRRRKLLIEQPAFPSDRYAAGSQVQYHGLSLDDGLLEIGPRDGEHYIRDDDIVALIEREGDEIALVLLPGVQYYSGQLFDIERITVAARAAGCAVGWDLAHAIGNVPLEMHNWDADFAVWCSYKYLNAGPGAIAGAFVHQRHAERHDLPRFAGWWGHDKKSRFRMGPDFAPIPGAEGWQLSNPPIFAMTPLLASLELFEHAGRDALRTKSTDLTAYLEWLIVENIGAQVEIITPRDPARRGCQLSVRLAGVDPEVGKSLHRALSLAGCVTDWREPDVIRVAPVPLYNSYEDVYRFVGFLTNSLRDTK